MVVGALLLNAIAVHAFGPYASGSTGYDVSFPQCGGAMPSGAFGIVGVNHGRPFTSNGCFATEYASAPNPSVYINTAFSGAYRKSITTYCSQQPKSTAWQIGCSEAETSLSYVGQSPVSMWWLDVETGNSWSSSSLGLNRDTIQGAADRLNQTGLPVGVYSTAASWRTITGQGYSPNGSVADWVAGGSCSTPFDSKPVWLSQHTSGFDYDTAC